MHLTVEHLKNKVRPCILRICLFFQIIFFAAVSFSSQISHAQVSATPTPWTPCAVEDAYCNVPAPATVRFGFGGSYFTKSITTQVLCANSVFGDPAYGKDKTCDYQVNSTTPVTPPPVSAAPWIPCAIEDGQCNFTGTQTVRYGANGKYVTRVATTTIACNNQTFGDPVPFADKACSSQLIATPPVVPPTPVPTSAPGGKWTTLQVLPFFPVHLHLLPTGKVLMWPGDEGISGNTPLIWDLVTQATTSPAGPGYDIFCAGHAFLPDGSLFVAGGHIDNNVGLPSSSIYNPFTNKWTNTPDMNAGRWYPTVTTLANGDMLTVSGDVDTTLGVNPVPQVFERATNTWRTLSDANLNQDLYPMMFLAPGGRMINVGPTPNTRYLDTSDTGSWAYQTTHNFGYRDYGSAVMYADGKILTVGGGDPPTSTAEAINLNDDYPVWRNVGSMAVARRMSTATVLPDGTVLMTGGTSGAGFSNEATPVFTAEIWDPTTEQWTTMAATPTKIPRLYHSVSLLLPDGRVLLTGGNGQLIPETYSPPYLFKGARPEVAAVPTNMAYGKQYAVQSKDAQSVAKVTLIRLGSVTHSFDQNQRLNVLPFSKTSTGVTITTPVDGSIAPPGHYQLFLVNNAGVPSVGKIIHLQ